MSTVKTGMGAMPIASGGVGFRVWAPFAQRIFVAGEFNGWSDSADQLQSEGNGNWSGDIVSANIGHQYRYVIHPFGGGTPIWRTDPRARRVNSEDDPADATIKRKNNGYVVKPAYIWDSGAFEMPGFNELVIYQLHVASFNAKGSAGSFDSLVEKLDYQKNWELMRSNSCQLLGFKVSIPWGTTRHSHLILRAAMAEILDFEILSKQLIAREWR